MEKFHNLSKDVSHAVTSYWKTRQTQMTRQTTSGRKDQGARSAVIGGAQMDGFINLISNLIIGTGIENLLTPLIQSDTNCFVENLLEKDIIMLLPF